MATKLRMIGQCPDVKALEDAYDKAFQRYSESKDTFTRMVRWRVVEDAHKRLKAARIEFSDRFNRCVWAEVEYHRHSRKAVNRGRVMREALAEHS